MYQSSLTLRLFSVDASAKHVYELAFLRTDLASWRA